MTGLLQTQDYARALISVQPQITQETVTARLAARMQRQERVPGRDNPPAAWFIIDELSLYRQVGSTQNMAAQHRHLLEAAATPKGHHAGTPRRRPPRERQRLPDGR